MREYFPYTSVSLNTNTLPRAQINILRPRCRCAFYYSLKWKIFSQIFITVLISVMCARAIEQTNTLMKANE